MKSSSRKRVILLIESSRAFGQLLVKGIVQYSRFHAQWSFYREAAGLNERGADVKWHADGIIAHVLNTKIAERIIPKGTPAVVKGINELIPRVCNIVGDTEAIASMAAEHLMNLGFKNFAYCGFKEVLWSREFGKFFCQRLEKAGFSVNLYSQAKAKVKRSWQKELERLVKWLHPIPKPVAIMACNDDRGQHISEACKIAEYRIPYDVAIIGVDNDEWICNLTSPPMTSIALNIERAGYEVAELLDRLMSGEPMKDQKVIIVPTHVVTRQSTDLLAVDDPEVFKALEFINKNFKKPIQIDDIVNATTASRRALYYRFKRIIGKSINNELRRVRVEHIARILVETSLPISRIAADYKYTSFRNIARYFKLEKGMSLLQYRQKFGSRI